MWTITKNFLLKTDNKLVFRIQNLLNISMAQPYWLAFRKKVSLNIKNYFSNYSLIFVEILLFLLSYFWGPQKPKRLIFSILYLKVGLNKLDIGSGVDGKIVLCLFQLHIVTEIMRLLMEIVRGKQIIQYGDRYSVFSI